MANYFYYDLGKKYGPFSVEQLRELAEQGSIKPYKTLITEGNNKEIKAEQIIDSRHFMKDDATLDKQGGVPLGKQGGVPLEKSPGFFDIHFTRFISNTWVSVIWVIAIIVQFCGALSAIYWAFQADEMTGMISLVLVPLITAISLLFTRMALEFDKVVFRIESNTRETKDLLREIKEQLGKK